MEHHIRYSITTELEFILYLYKYVGLADWIVIILPRGDFRNTTSQSEPKLFRGPSRNSFIYLDSTHLNLSEENHVPGRRKEFYIKAYNFIMC